MLILTKHHLKLTCNVIIILILAISGLTGCTGVLGGYKHDDLSKSHYREIILNKADKLAHSQTIKDKATAAQLYGSIKELDLMDKCITEYFEQEPDLGLFLIERGKKIHKYYRSSPN